MIIELKITNITGLTEKQIWKYEGVGVGGRQDDV